MDKCLSYSPELTVANVSEALGITGYAELFNLLNNIILKDPSTAVEIIENIRIPQLNIMNILNNMLNQFENSQETSQETSQEVQSALETAQQTAEDAQQTAEEAKDVVKQVQEAVEEVKQDVKQVKEEKEEKDNKDNKSDKQEESQTEEQITEPAEPAEPTTLDIISTASISDINVEYGAPANLPTTITATLSDNSTQDLAIIWDNGMPSFDQNASGSYVFSGALILPENVTNTNNLNATANVVVAPQPVEEIVPEEVPIEEIVNEVADLVENASSSLLNGIWNFIKWIIGTPIKTLSSLPVTQKATAGLLAPIQNILNLLQAR
jgi:myosin heavy subunit